MQYERAGEIESINGCYLHIGMETRNYDHVEMIAQALKDNGFKLIEKGGS